MIDYDSIWLVLKPGYTARPYNDLLLDLKSEFYKLRRDQAAATENITYSHATLLRLDSGASLYASAVSAQSWSADVGAFAEISHSNPIFFDIGESIDVSIMPTGIYRLKDLGQSVEASNPPNASLWRDDKTLGLEVAKMGMGRQHLGKILESAELSGKMSKLAKGEIQDAELTLIER